MKHIITASFLAATSMVQAQNSEINQTQLEQAVQGLSNQKVTIKSINKTPFEGINEVVLMGGSNQQVVYLSHDGQYMFEGKIFNLKEKKNLTEITENSLRQELLATFKKHNKSIDFLPENMTDHITVFTDIDCGYCRKLHQEVEHYNEVGIGVSYLFFPRAGLNTSSHQKAVNVWCADDQKQAMTDAKNGIELEPLMCRNPIESQYNLGIGAGIHKVGTPAVITSDGTVIPGYLSAPKMKTRIEQIKAKN